MATVGTFFAPELNEEHLPIAERGLSALNSPYVKTTLEFMNFVLDELVGLNRLFISDNFQLHALHPELLRVIKMFALNFMKRSTIQEKVSWSVAGNST